MKGSDVPANACTCVQIQPLERPAKAQVQKPLQNTNDAKLYHLFELSGAKPLK